MYHSFQTTNDIIMGNGSVEIIGKKLKEFQAKEVIIITDEAIQKAGIVNKVVNYIEKEGVGVVVNTGCLPEPSFELLERLNRNIEKKYDVYIGLGGGSVLDIAKMLAVMKTNPSNTKSFVGINLLPNKGKPTIMIPTTSGTGSEVTFNAIFTDEVDNVKKGIVSPYLLPDVAILDPELTVTCPPGITAATGMDAFVHAVESFTSKNANSITDSMAIHAVKLIYKALPKAVNKGDDIEARENMAMGSLLAGMAFSNAGVGAVHALAYPLGGKFKVPHGIANSVLLPYVLKFNITSVTDKFALIAEAIGKNIEGLTDVQAAEKMIKLIVDLIKSIGIPDNIKQFGVSESDIPKMAEEASKIDRLLRNNPRELSLDEIELIYYNAYAGVLNV